MRETWYVLEDGTVANPGECGPDEKGALTHKSGVKVAMRFPDCPMSRGVDAPDAEAPAPATKPPRKPYKNRELKSE